MDKVTQAERKLAGTCILCGGDGKKIEFLLVGGGPPTKGKHCYDCFLELSRSDAENRYTLGDSKNG